MDGLFRHDVGTDTSLYFYDVLPQAPNAAQLPRELKQTWRRFITAGLGCMPKKCHFSPDTHSSSGSSHQQRGQSTGPIETEQKLRMGVPLER